MSTDYINDARSSIVDAACTQVGKERLGVRVVDDGLRLDLWRLRSGPWSCNPLCSNGITPIAAEPSALCQTRAGTFHTQVGGPHQHCRSQGQCITSDVTKQAFPSITPIKCTHMSDLNVEAVR